MPPPGRRKGSQVPPGAKLRKRARKVKPPSPRPEVTTDNNVEVRSARRSPAAGTPSARPKSRPAPARQPGPYQNRERKRVTKYKRTSRKYRGAVRDAYDSRPEADRRERQQQIIQRLIRADTGTAASERAASERQISPDALDALSPEDLVLLKLHSDRATRNEVLAEGRARSTGMTDQERRGADRFRASDSYQKVMDTLRRDEAEQATAGLSADDVLGAAGDVGKFAVKGGIFSVPVRAFKNVAQAAIEDPGQVAKSSARTAVESVAGIPQGLKMLIEHPDQALKAMGEDYVDRYAPLLKGEDKEFRENLKKKYGVTPYVLDASAAVSGGGAIAGGVARSGPALRVASRLSGSEGAVARGAGRMVSAATKTATRHRPNLRFSGGEGGAVPQRTSRNLFTAAGQRVLDSKREKRFVRDAEKAGYRVAPGGKLERIPGRKAERMGGLRPGENEVLPYYSLRESGPLKGMTGRVARDIGGVKSKGRIRLLTERGRVLPKVQKLIDRLTPEEQIALKSVVELGLRPDRLEDATRAVQTRLATIQRERKQAGREKTAAVLEDTNDELVPLREILKDPEAHLTPQVREVADELIAIQRQMEAADPDLSPQRARARASKPQEMLLGLDRDIDPVTARAARDEELRQEAIRETSADPRTEKFRALMNDTRTPMREREAASRAFQRVIARRFEEKKRAAPPIDEKAARLAPDEFDARVRDAAEKAGLADPGYWMSSPRPRQTYSNAAVGTGGKAAGKSKAYTGTLHRLGAEEYTPDVFVSGVERNIKRRFQWALVTRNMDTHAFEWSRGARGEGMLAGDILKYMDEQGIDASTVSFMNSRIARDRPADPVGTERGKFTEADDDVLVDAHAELRGARLDSPDDPASGVRKLQEEAALVRDLSPDEIRGMAQNRYLAVPRSVADELEAMSKPDGKWGRGLEILLKQKPARIILGTLNVPWLSFQVASNAMLTGLGGGKNPLDIYGAHKWWRGLTDAEKDAVEVELGITRGSHHAIDQTKMGSTVNGRFSNFYRAYKASKVGRNVHKANPLDAMFRMDEAQNNFFRKVLFYNQAKKTAYKEMGASWRSMDGVQKKLMEVVGRPPEELGGAIPQSGRLFEEHAAHVNDFLGNYLTFSNAERRHLSRHVMFYGYLRFSLRFTFWTMPVKHPVMTDLLGNLGRMGADEIKELFGVEPDYWLPTHMLAKVYFGDREDAKRGELESINFGRMNPALNAATQISSPTEANQLTGLVSPIYQAMADQLFEESSFTGRDWRIKGKPSPAESQRPKDYYGDLGDRARIFGGQLAGLAFPYRVAEKTGIPGLAEPLEGPQGDDSLLFAPRPTRYKDEEVKKSIAKSTGREKREREERGVAGTVLSELLPFTPRRDAAPQVVARELEKEADAKNQSTGKKKRRRKKKGGGFKWSGGSGGGSGGGGWSWGDS